VSETWRSQLAFSHAERHAERHAEGSRSRPKNKTPGPWGIKLDI